jgi:hypothetical protein
MKTRQITVDNELLVDVAIDIAVDGIIDEIIDKLNSREFLDYLAKILQQELNNIAISRLTTVTEEDADKSLYLNSMKLDIDYSNQIITLYNDAEIDTSTRNISEEKRANYPLKLSLASIVEFGIGYTGSNSEAAQKLDMFENNDWQYDVNNHGAEGWYYKDPDSDRYFWTNGFEGRQVFIGLIEWIENNISQVIDKYIDTL